MTAPVTGAAAAEKEPYRLVSVVDSAGALARVLCVWPAAEPAPDAARWRATLEAIRALRSRMPRPARPAPAVTTHLRMTRDEREYHLVISFVA